MDWVSSTVQYQYLNTVAMLDLNTGWVAGDQWNTTGQNFENTIIQWSGSIFSEVYNINTGATGLFNDIDVITASDVWAVGDQSNISYWNGTNWDQVVSPTSNHFSAVSMVSTDEGWIAGNDGVLLSYSPAPTLDINYLTGEPGSFFTLTGSNFPISSSVNIFVNNLLLGSIQSDTYGSFTFLLSTAQANEGIYFVTASVNPSATVRFDLDITEPLRTQNGSGTIFEVPSDIEYTDLIYLPIVVK